MRRLALPLKSLQTCDGAPGVLLTTHRTMTKVAEVTKLLPGDIVFFETDAGIGAQHRRESRRVMDRVAMYLGIDEEGNHRFISSPRS